MRVRDIPGVVRDFIFLEEKVGREKLECRLLNLDNPGRAGSYRASVGLAVKPDG